MLAVQVASVSNSPQVTFVNVRAENFVSLERGGAAYEGDEGNCAKHDAVSACRIDVRDGARAVL